MARRINRGGYWDGVSRVLRRIFRKPRRESESG